jgi:hypothetical protein
MNKNQPPTTLKVGKATDTPPGPSKQNHNETTLKVHQGLAANHNETSLKVRKGLPLNHNETELQVRKDRPIGDNHNETALRIK